MYGGGKKVQIYLETLVAPALVTINFSFFYSFNFKYEENDIYFFTVALDELWSFLCYKNIKIKIKSSNVNKMKVNKPTNQMTIFFLKLLKTTRTS